MRHLLRIPLTPTFPSVFVTVVKRTLREMSLLTASEADVAPILYVVKLSFIGSTEAQFRLLNQRIINPSKMLAFVKLMYVLPWIKLAFIYPLGFRLIL